MLQDSKILTVGFDEAGRGPLAGPVSAAAVILPDDFPLEILNDSKKLSEKKRLYAEEIIKEKACWGIGLVDHATIDRINILNASMLAMKIAFEVLMEKFPEWKNKNNIQDFVLKGITDGTKCPEVFIECRAEPKADANYPQVMAASILAKTCRDKIMVEMDKKYPQYGYAKHKGYPTRDHVQICREIGPSPIQRMSFKY
ncbi:MAG: ribonuclease HII [Treponema sp.]|jgi:ribonuclease HII|nr:ribonuclease HII [Treponema sp.]